MVDALAQASTTAGPVTITVSGVCPETVTISRNNVTLQGASVGDGLIDPLANSTVLTLDGAQGVFLNQLTLTGGFLGLESRGGAVFTANKLRVENSASTGINISDANGRFVQATIRGNGDAGISVGLGGHAVLETSQVDGNGSHGVEVNGGSVLLRETRIESNGRSGVIVIDGGNIKMFLSTITGNAQNGVSVQAGGFGSIFQSHLDGNPGSGLFLFFGAFVSLTDTTVNNNLTDGITIGGGSSVLLRNGVTIKANGGTGVLVRDTSVVGTEFGDGTVTITLNNGGGVICELFPSVAQITTLGPAGFSLGALSVDGNTGGPEIDCPGLSLP